MTPVLFSFRAGVPEQARASALERIRALPAIERAGWLFPEGGASEAAGTLVATVGPGFDPRDVVAALSGMPEVEEASTPAERVLVG